jgi:VWFA-related protein
MVARPPTAVLFFVAAAGLAQQAAPPPLAQRIDVTVVNVDVTVLDRHGNPVMDLTKDDFEIREDDVRREVTNFSVIKREPPAPRAGHDAPFVSNAEARRTVVVVVDTRTFEDLPRRSRAVDGLQKLLGEYPDDSRWSIVILRNGLRSTQTLLPMTADRLLINGALDAVRKGVSLPSSAAAAINRLKPPGTDVLDCPVGCSAETMRAGIDAAQEMESNQSFYAAVVQVARGMAWLPGKKVILIVSSAVPGFLSPAQGASAAQQVQLHKRMVEEANAAGANIYIIDPLGMTAGIDIGHGDYFAKDANLPSGGGQRNTSGAVWLAEQTGGLYLPSNDIGQSLETLHQSTTNYYELGYHASEPDEKYHRITVTVKRPGRYTVTHRSGYVRLSHEEALIRTLSTPLGIASQHPTLPVQLTIGDPERDGKERWMVPFRASIPANSLEALARSAGPVKRAHVYVSVFDDEGRLVQFKHFVETVTKPLPTDATVAISHAVSLGRGAYRMFVTVRDELSDEVGVAVKRIAL